MSAPLTDINEEDRVLAEMLALAERLATSEDALMSGQYAYLKARIEALIALRGFGAGAGA